MIDNKFLEDDSIGLQDVDSIGAEDRVASPVIQLLMEKYTKAETTRRIDEERWLQKMISC